MRRVAAVVGALALTVGACGGDGDSIAPTTALGGDSNSATTSASPATTSPEQVVAPTGPVDVNTIRIGSDVWQRTLPMTSGQCFLQAGDANLPESATAWGTLDGDDAMTFAANLQDGAVESEVKNNSGIYWIAGPRSPGLDDLVIELDFDNLTIRGSGTFTSLLSNETATGSFEFKCEE